MQTTKVKNQTLRQRYCQTIKNSYLYFKELSSYMVADACFAKKEAVDAITACGLHFISRLQKNAVLYCIDNKRYTLKRGCHENFLGKVNQKMPGVKFFTLRRDTKMLKINN